MKRGSNSVSSSSIGASVKTARGIIVSVGGLEDVRINGSASIPTFYYYISYSTSYLQRRRDLGSIRENAAVQSGVHALLRKMIFMEMFY